MSEPVRLQLSRRAGFDLQELSQAANGLPAVNVARPSRWGNPFIIGKDVSSAAEAVKEFRSLTAPHPPHVVPLYMGLDDIARDLRGKNLACWCKPGAPCHADVLLELANRPICEEVAP